MKIQIEHTTRYTYSQPITDNHNEARMMPLTDELQTCADFWLTTDPVAHIFFYNLPGGRVHHFNIRAPHNELTVSTTATVLTNHVDPFANLQFTDEDAGYYESDIVREDNWEYLMPTERVPLDSKIDTITEAARRVADGPSTAAFLIALNRVIHRVLEYVPGVTNVDSSIEHVLQDHRGVCQDFTHIMLAVCRRRGIPARYVSGYLYTAAGEQGDDLFNGNTRALVDLGLTTDAPPPQRPHASLVDGGAMHAWVECLLPDGVWCGFDPTNNLLTTDAYVRVHLGRDYGDVPPLRGVFVGPQAAVMDVSVKVTAE